MIETARRFRGPNRTLPGAARFRAAVLSVPRPEGWGLGR
jgi:hypothetical protein